MEFGLTLIYHNTLSTNICMLLFLKIIVFVVVKKLDSMETDSAVWLK